MILVVPTYRKDHPGTNGVPIPVRHSLRPGNGILFVPPGYLTKPERTIQYNGGVGAGLGVSLCGYGDALDC
jgi:hypothetical protein